MPILYSLRWYGNLNVIDMENPFWNGFFSWKEPFFFYTFVMTWFNYRSRGNVGEDLAVSYLETHWYEIIERNATFLGGELDIVCKKDGIWRFVEVKYRESTIFGYPEDSMTPRKIKTLLRAIEMYCTKKDIDYSLTRMDFLGILRSPEGDYEYRLVEDVN